MKPTSHAMLRCALAVLFVCAGSARAGEVLDTFDDGSNPNGWRWSAGNDGVPGSVQPTGGNPGGWFDSDAPYWASHPGIYAVPDDGSPLRAALASGELVSVSVDFQKLDVWDVPNCVPTNSAPSKFSLKLIDLHSMGGNQSVYAWRTGASAPGGAAYPWTTAQFDIPWNSSDTPPGWTLVSPDPSYTWADLMNNLDSIALLPVGLDDIVFDACWHLGVDNVRVSFGDAIFRDGFEAAD
jgi:hypothetical protein